MRRGHSPQDTDLVDSSLFDVATFTDEYLGNEGKLDPLRCRSAINAIAKVNILKKLKFIYLGSRKKITSKSGSNVHISAF